MPIPVGTQMSFSQTHKIGNFGIIDNFSFRNMFFPSSAPIDVSKCEIRNQGMHHLILD